MDLPLRLRQGESGANASFVIRSGAKLWVSALGSEGSGFGRAAVWEA